MPTSGPLLILPPALKWRGSPTRQGLCSHLTHKLANSGFAPRSEAMGMAIREKGRKEHVAWVKDAAHCVMRAISSARGKVKVWYDALDDRVSFLACFHRTSSKRMRGLWCKGGKFCFFRRTGVRWVEAMFHELDIVLENLLAVLEHLPEYINHEAELGRREKAQGLFDALSHPLFKFTAAFFCHVFAVVCATSKKVQATKGARIAAV